MKLKSIYSFLSYVILSLFSVLLIIACLVDLLQSIEYSVKAMMYFGLFFVLAYMIFNFRQKIKEGLNLSFLFALMGQVSLVFFIFIFLVWGHKSSQDQIFEQELQSIKDQEIEPEVRIAKCEKVFSDYKDKHSFIQQDIESACVKMFIDVSRESYLNVIPALDSLSRLESHQKPSGYLASLKVCLTAEAGQVDLALQMAHQYELNSTVKSLKQHKHCKIFLNRNVASDL